MFMFTQTLFISVNQLRPQSDAVILGTICIMSNGKKYTDGSGRDLI